MGENYSCQRFCCPSDKHYLISELTSPKNIIQVADVPTGCRKSLSELKSTSSGCPFESPVIERRRHFRTNTAIVTKKSFLAKARERNKFESGASSAVLLFDEEEENRSKSLTYTEENDGAKKYIRISLDSPGQNQGDWGLIDYP
jgi:hypothetical protein